MRSIRFSAIVMTVLVSLAGTFALSGCTDYAPEFSVTTTSYSKASATELLGDVSSGDMAGESASDAAELRQRALTALRSEGEDGSAAADFITESFPADTAGVPLYVEKARFNGQAAWLIVEAIGQPGGQLEDKRLWVITPSGDVLLSATE